MVIAATGASGCSDPAGSSSAEFGTLADSVVQTSSTYTLVGVQSGKCVEFASTSSGTQAQIATCNGTTSQQFRFEATSTSGYYAIRNVASNLCLDVEGSSAAAGARVLQYGCHSGTNQQFGATDLGSTIHRIAARHSGLVLDVSGANTADGSKIVQWTSYGSTNQQFKLSVVTSSSSSTSSGALHVSGRDLLDGNNQRVLLRGPELVYRWGTYAGLTDKGVDVPWEGGRNGSVGAKEISEIAKTKATAIRLFGGFASEIDANLNVAINQEKMFVSVARVNWENADVKAVLKKYEKYIILHPRGEFTHRDAAKWRTEALAVVKYIRGLGYNSPIELGTTGYGQTWSTISQYGAEVAQSDPKKNTLFLLQLYSELAKDIPNTLNQLVNFPHPVIADACLFQGGINDGLGNTSTTYRQVWDQSFTKNLSSFYWDWYGDGEGNSMTKQGTLASVNSVGQYLVYDSPAALSKGMKTSFLLNALAR